MEDVVKGKMSSHSPRRIRAGLRSHLLLTLLVLITTACTGEATPEKEKSGSNAETSPAVSESKSPMETVDRETLSQVSTLGALASGIYDGFTSVDEISRMGDFGLGTFENLDGEMIQVADGVFRVNAAGEARKVDSATRSPFFATTFFDADQTFELAGPLNLGELQNAIDAELPNLSVPWAIRIEGTVSYLKTRSVPAQERPFPPLGEVVKTQPTFEFENIRGTLVGIRLPDFLGGVNLAGHHFHFISEDRKAGGHVLALRASDVTVEADETATFKMIVPSSSEAFESFSAPKATPASE